MVFIVIPTKSRYSDNDKSLHILQ